MEQTLMSLLHQFLLRSSSLSNWSCLSSVASPHLCRLLTASQAFQSPRTTRSLQVGRSFSVSQGGCQALNCQLGKSSPGGESKKTISTITGQQARQHLGEQGQGAGGEVDVQDGKDQLGGFTHVLAVNLLTKLLHCSPNHPGWTTDLKQSGHLPSTNDIQPPSRPSVAPERGKLGLKGHAVPWSTSPAALHRGGQTPSHHLFEQCSPSCYFSAGSIVNFPHLPYQASHPGTD